MKRRTLNNVNSYNGTKECRRFLEMYDEITSRYVALEDFADDTVLFREYTEAVRDLIKSDFLYSTRVYRANKREESYEKDPSGRKTPDEDYCPSCNDLTRHLIRSDLYDENDLLDIITAHVTERPNLLFKTVDSKHAYNSLKLYVRNKLVDLFRTASCKNTISIIDPDPEENYDWDHVISSNELSSPGNIESDTINNISIDDAKEHFVHELIAMFRDKHQENRMIAYLSTIAECYFDINLYRTIYYEGFNAALTKCVHLLKEHDFDLDYLLEEKIDWKLKPRNINKHTVKEWADQAQEDAQTYAKSKGLI